MLQELHLRHSDTPTRTRGQRIKRGIRRNLKRDFLQLYRATWSFTVSCQRIGVARSTIHRWRRQDEAFNEKIEAISLALYRASLPTDEELRAIYAKSRMSQDKIERLIHALRATE